ncbi:NAD(P)-binding protein [Microthyrium microscopicum]|uniref:NAD(P)-binding protein n=1 Tax=Microthyrium microscopicum TaxID=703497 RepID=A0A6A6UGV1_9PEZI|nr:NAD(P)-binding protein [Microthyrium microscopicum]
MAERKMRIAVAGTNHLALLIATFVTQYTSHQIIVLSRHAQPQLTDENYQVMVVDYDSQESLQHAVMGIHTIISTVTGNAQVALIQAAVAQGVRRFAPAEFEGPLVARQADDPLDASKSATRDWLDHFRDRMASTVFTCGVLYERFAPWGLSSPHVRLCQESEYGSEGDYLVNPRNLRANAPLYDHTGHEATLCLTAAQDVAYLVVRALDMKSWPRELTMAGEHMTVAELLATILRVRGRPTLHLESRTPTYNELTHELHNAMIAGDEGQQLRARELIATANRRYVFPPPGTLRDLNRSYTMIRFEDWLRHNWAPHAVLDD